MAGSLCKIFYVTVISFFYIITNDGEILKIPQFKKKYFLQNKMGKESKFYKLEVVSQI